MNPANDRGDGVTVTGRARGAGEQAHVNRFTLSGEIFFCELKSALRITVNIKRE